MQVGRYYLEQRDYLAAINRFKTVVTQYQTTRHVEEALERLAEANMALGLTGEAQTAAAVLGHNFPDSPWYKDAYKLLEDRRPGAAREHGVVDQQGVCRQEYELIRFRCLPVRPCSSPLPSATSSSSTGSARDFSAGPDGVHRRDRRRQVDPARCPVAGARRARRRLAGARGQPPRATSPRSSTSAADHPARAILAESGIEAEGDLILRRVQGADGRSRAFVNDQPVSVVLLRQVGAALVEIHGQHDDRAMVEPAMHRALLDAFGGLDARARRGRRGLCRAGGRRTRRWPSSGAGSPRPAPRPTICAPRSTS